MLTVACLLGIVLSVFYEAYKKAKKQVLKEPQQELFPKDEWEIVKRTDITGETYFHVLRKQEQGRINGN